MGHPGGLRMRIHSMTAGGYFLTVNHNKYQPIYSIFYKKQGVKPVIGTKGISLCKVHGGLCVVYFKTVTICDQLDLYFVGSGPIIEI